jgi:hypothetical protein
MRHDKSPEDPKPELKERVDEAEPIPTEIDYAFPDSSLRDWVSYADQVSEIEILSETRGTLHGDAAKAGEGLITRFVDVRIVATIWWNSEVRAEAQTNDLYLGTIGWHEREGKLHELVPGDAARLELGGKYVAALQQHPAGWSFLTSRCVLAAGGDEIAEKDVAEHGEGEVAEMLSGMSHEEMRSLLNSIRPYEEAAANWDRTPEERLAAVLRAQDMGIAQ